MSDKRLQVRVVPGTLLVGVWAVLFGAGGCVPGSSLAPFAATRAERAVEKGDSYLKNQELDAALVEFQTAIELHPKLAVAHSKVGWIQEAKGNLEAAARAYGEAVKISPFNYDYSYALAHVYQRMARFADAVRAYQHACELKPQDFQARLNLGVCYHQTGELDEALGCYTQVTELQPDDPGAYTNIGAVYDAKGEYYRAIHAYNQSLERNPDQPMVLVNLATTMIRQERYSNARKALARAIDQDPKLAIAYERLGYCYFRERDYKEALTQYEWAALLGPTMPEAQAGLGVVRMAMYLQNPDQTELRRMAIEHWHRSLELNPDQPKIRSLIEKYHVPQDDSDTVLLGTR